jgi:hypothetical protein
METLKNHKNERADQKNLKTHSDSKLWASLPSSRQIFRETVPLTEISVNMIICAWKIFYTAENSSAINDLFRIDLSDIAK